MKFFLPSELFHVLTPLVRFWIIDGVQAKERPVLKDECGLSSVGFGPSLQKVVSPIAYAYMSFTTACRSVGI